MGFFSWTSVKDGMSIMNKYGHGHDGIVVVFPNDEVVMGDYDGYGRIDTGKGIYDIHVLTALKGDLEAYKEADPNLIGNDWDNEKFEELHSVGVGGFLKSTGYYDHDESKKDVEPLPVKAMTILDYQMYIEDHGKLTWNDFKNISGSAEGQGHWLDSTHDDDFKFEPLYLQA
jgi:hypothetical protein